MTLLSLELPLHLFQMLGLSSYFLIVHYCSLYFIFSFLFVISGTYVIPGEYMSFPFVVFSFDFICSLFLDLSFSVILSQSCYLNHFSRPFLTCLIFLICPFSLVLLICSFWFEFCLVSFFVFDTICSSCHSCGIFCKNLIYIYISKYCQQSDPALKELVIFSSVP